MKKYFLLYIVLIFMAGCQEPFYPNVDETEKSLVVDGLLSTKPGKSRVVVTKSAMFSKHPVNLPVNNLTIYTLDSLNARIDFIENGTSGIYVTGKTASSAGKIGNTYTLYIETPEGDIYKSVPQKLNECPEIQKISIQIEQQPMLTEDSNGEIQELVFQGIGIYADTKAILPESNYYLNKWYGYEQHHSSIGLTGQQASDIYRHVAISSAYTRLVCTSNADETYSKYIRNNKFVFIPEYTFKSYVPPIPEGYNFYYDQFDGYIFVSDQYSISKDAYVFWKGSKDQLEASGKLFGPVTSQIKSNLTCITDPEKSIFGVFYASDIKTRYDYIFYRVVNSRSRLFTTQLDTVPELWLDTCSWRLPNGWYNPPF